MDLARPSRARSPGPVRHISKPLQERNDSALGLLPLHSPLLRESSLVSLPPLSNMLKFSGCSRPTSGRCGISFVRSFSVLLCSSTPDRDPGRAPVSCGKAAAAIASYSHSPLTGRPSSARPTRIHRSFQLCFSDDPEAGAVKGSTRGRNSRSDSRCSMCSAIHTNYRSWLRPSSTREPSDSPSGAVIIPLRSAG